MIGLNHLANVRYTAHTFELACAHLEQRAAPERALSRLKGDSRLPRC
jgi:hypothetical protein